MLRIVVAAPPRIRRPQDLALSLPTFADVIELRLDLLEAEGLAVGDLTRWVVASPRPVLATLRSQDEGGAFAGTPQEAARRLAAAAHAGARFLDVEVPVAALLPPLPSSVDVIVSHHGAASVVLPAEVGGRVVFAWKVARPTDDAAMLARLRDEVARPTARPRTIVPYGRLGAVRAAFCSPGSLLYGGAAEGERVAPGQPSLGALLDELRAGEVTPDASLYGLLGHPPAHSPSPAMHNAAFRRLGRDALYVPLPDVDLPQALALPFAGYSVTMPYKTEALAAATSAGPAARAIGAANTLVRRGNTWHARNTDAVAIAASVPAGEGAGAFVYGSGGYARAAAYALAQRGYVVRLGARHEGRGHALAASGGWSFEGAEYRRRPNDRLILNATPAGAKGLVPDALALPDYDGLVVLDAPYAADGGLTGLVAAARATARQVIDGRALLVAQARGQVAAFTGEAVDDDVLWLAVSPPASLLLLGLRGAGKSTAGRRLARRLGRPFVDLDADVTRITGRAPASWIRDEGEAAFRDVEVEALERVAGRRGVVVAAGGGVLEHPRALELVPAHFVPAWLDLSPQVAAGRVVEDGADRPPLLAGATALEEARDVYERRRDRWAATSAFVVDASAAVDEVVASLARAWIAHARSTRAP